MALVELENYAERIYADLARSHLAYGLSTELNSATAFFK